MVAGTWPWVAVLVSILVSAAVTYGVMSQRWTDRARRERAQLQAGWETTRATLELEIERLQEAAGAAGVRGGSGVGQEGLDAADALRRLTALRPGPDGWTVATLRQLITGLVRLGEAGPGAIPAIRDFLRASTDTVYPEVRHREGFRGASAIGDPGQTSAFGGDGDGLEALQFVSPPTLRIGLFDAVREIGGERAERLLAETLRTATDGREVAYLARLLEDMAPGKYRDLALMAAAELLENPSPTVGMETADEEGRRYLEWLVRRWGGRDGG